MKRYIIYIALLICGIIIGSLIFSNKKENVKNDLSSHSHINKSNNQQLWTCSMHPQIMQPEPGDCPICGMDLIPADAGADGLAMNEIKMTTNAMALANISTTVVGNKMTENGGTIALSGKIKMNEEENAVQASYFDGRIEQLNVNYEGQEVRKGQLLATIYAPNLIAAQQELITAASLKESQPSLYQAVRNKLKLWKLSESQINSIEESGKVKENFPIYATVSGTVSEKMASEGDYVKQGQPIVKVSNLNSVWAEFDAYENQISEFKKGQPIKIGTNAYPNKEFDATISFIAPVLDTRTRTTTVRANLKNNEGLLKPGMFVIGNVASKSGNSKAPLHIPASAVMWTGERSLVYIKTRSDEPVFEMREIMLGNKNGAMYTVVSGLESGDEIVTNGTFTVDAAAQLQGKKSMMNKTGGKTMTGHEGHLGMDNNASKKEIDHTNMNERLPVSEKFQEQLKVVYNDYINLKDALVKDDSKNTTDNATSLLNDLGKVDMKLLSDNNAHSHWMSLIKEIKSSATSISKSSDIKEQRDHFKHLSSHLIKAVQLFGVNEKVYLEFCPMADNNKGGYWLSREEKVLNPYFGKAMQTCGSVIDSVQ